MKLAKLTSAIAAVLLAGTVLVLPRIIEARRSSSGYVPHNSGVAQNQRSNVIVGRSVHNDTSAPLRYMKQLPMERKPEREANENPKVPNKHKDEPDEVAQRFSFLSSPSTNIPTALLNFDGIPFPGVSCNCAPPDTNGEVGATQYVQIVNEGFQVFNKSTGASQLGPSGITTLWNGFGGVCQNNGSGDPVVLYDQLANRWMSVLRYLPAAMPPARTTATTFISVLTSSTIHI